MANHSTIQTVASYVHEARLAPYIADCGRDRLRALELYKWNLRLSSEFQQVLSVTEVVLRNAIDAELRKWNQGRTTTAPNGATHHHGPDWTTDAARPLNRLTSDARRSAKKHADEAADARHPAHARATAAIDHNDLVSQLTFGVWAKLLPTEDTSDANFTRRKILWDQAVKKAFPYRGNDPDGYGTARRAARLHALRNRVSHAEPLLEVNVVSRHNDALRLLGSISPEVRDWCSGLSRVIEVNRTRPTPRP